MILSAVFARGGENVNFLTQMRTKCVLKYQKSTHCVPNVNFADLFGSPDRHLSRFPRPYWGPLAAILEFAGGAVLPAVSQCPPHR